MINSADLSSPFIKDGSSSSERLTEKEQTKILTGFIERISDQKDMPPEYQKLANEHFWDLI